MPSSGLCRSFLVTGGNRGIGLEVVRLLLQPRKPVGRVEGEHCAQGEQDPAREEPGQGERGEGEGQGLVWLGSRDQASGEQVVQDLRRELGCGDRLRLVRLDVTDPASISRAVSGVGAAGALDVLVNNAGILPEAAPGAASPSDPAVIRDTLRVNFEGLVAVTTAFLPLLAKSRAFSVLSTSSGCGTRTLGLVSEAHRQQLTDPSLGMEGLVAVLKDMETALRRPDHPYHAIPTVGYGLSKMAVNCYTQLLAREHPAMQINACSPGFTNTRMCAGYTGPRRAKSPALGASVFHELLCGTLARGKTGTFFKQASKAGTPLSEATSVVEPWVTLPK